MKTNQIWGPELSSLKRYEIIHPGEKPYCNVCLCSETISRVTDTNKIVIPQEYKKGSCLFNLMEKWNKSKESYSVG